MREKTRPKREPGCGAPGPETNASRTPAQGFGGSGARRRSGPTGGAAYGMPRKANTPRRSNPRTLPLRVSTCIPRNVAHASRSANTLGPMTQKSRTK